MGRSISPILRRELENLDKDADSRKSAMKALRSYVKDLDSKAIPLFLAQVSETKETGTSAGEYTISLYEVLARVHGPKIVPQIDNIMTTIIKILTSSAGSFALHQACSKVVPAIARYGMDPTTPEDKKRHIIHSLCKPLSDSLLGSHESLSSGSALCLKALVDSDNWRFASGEMVNEVCLRVAGVLEKSTLSNSHMGLVMALAKHNSLIVEAYARLLIQSGLRILNAGVAEGNSQKRLSAIQMVNFLMKCLDPKSIFSELGLIIEEMEKCQSDQMAYVKGAAFEALQTAKRIVTDKGPKLDHDTGSFTGSNFGRRGNSQSPRKKFMGSVNRKLWRQYENSRLDVSLKDGLYSEVSRGNTVNNSECDEFLNGEGYYTDGFAGFLQGSPRNGFPRSTTPSPQDPNDETPDFSEKQTRMFRSPSSSKFEWSPASKYDQNGHHHDQNGHSPNTNYELKKDEKLSDDSGRFQGGSESVSSTEDILINTDLQVPPGSKIEPKSLGIQKNNRKSAFGAVSGLFVLLFALLICLLRIDDQGDGYNLVPT
ncbi:ARM repeat superfamily protein [Actinidia rufa]|uniref:ARM repeat superfamily protein n=1 Tax=Actinidia rufa TaxID=165716 RepID=A0A7J0FMK0_9ERIC|nr:ARM repeat superfamily protein [Actinidia rufa]